MRRDEKEIISREIIDTIIKNSFICRVAMCKDNIPYMVPLSFGYDGKYIYLHTAPEGKKIEFFEGNNLVCFEFDIEVELKRNNNRACDWSFDYESVIGNGRIFEINDFAFKKKALKIIMQHYSELDWEIPDKEINNLRTWKIHIESISGKKSLNKNV